MLQSLRVRRELAALLAYSVLALVLTYPLVLHLGTRVAGDGGDDPALAWNLWWVRHALFDLGVSPIETNYMFFPIGINLAFYTLTYLNAFLSIPVQFTLGLIPAANLNLLLSFALSGFGAFLLAFHLLRREVRACAAPAAFAAGLLYAFSSNKLLYASLGQFNIASSQWIPFYLLFLFRLLPPHRPGDPRAARRNGLLLGLFMLFQALSEFIFASFLILFTAAYLIYWLMANRLRISRASVLGLAAAAIVFLLPMSPLLAAMLADMRQEGDFIQSGLGFSNIFSADLLGFFVPSPLHPLFRGLAGQFHFPYINFVYLGYVALALALVGLWRVPRARLWAFWFLLTGLIALGPTLRVNGAEYQLPFLPFNALLEIPLVKGNRYPSRWSVLLTLWLALMVSYGVAAALNALRERYARRSWSLAASLAAAALCALLLFEHLSLPLPTYDLTAPALYDAMAREPGDFTVMELPLAWRNGFRVTGSYRADSQAPIDRIFMLAQYYQSTQQHPILNGNTSRNPEYKFQYFSEAPFFPALIGAQTGHSLSPELLARAKALAPDVLRFLGTRFIVWHAPYEPANRDVANQTREFVEQNLPVTKIGESYEDGRGVALYRVADLPAPRSVTIARDDPLLRLYLGEGWALDNSNYVWAERSEVRLLARLDPQGGPVRLTFKGKPAPQIEPRAYVTVNGRATGAIDLTNCADGCERSVTFPAGVFVNGMNEIVFQFDRLTPVSAIREGRYTIDGCCTVPVNLSVRSAGEEQGAFGHIYVNGRDESPNRRGYNVVVLDPQSGAVQARENYDTFASEAESARLADFIGALPEGSIVAVAASDEASNHLTDEAVQALRSIGATADLRGKFRWSHAIVGAKGAPPGKALEAASELEVSELIVGLGATEPNAAAAFEQVRLEPQALK